VVADAAWWERGEGKNSGGSSGSELFVDLGFSVHDLEPHEGVVRRSSWWWVVRSLVVDVGSAVYGESYTWVVRFSASTICCRSKGWLISSEEGER